MAQPTGDNTKLLLEMAIHELCLAQERITELHYVIRDEIHPRITQALSSLDDVMAAQAIEMDEDIHHTFLDACKRATFLQQEMDCLPKADFTFKKEKTEHHSETSEETPEKFTVILPKAQKPLNQPAMQAALTIERYRSYSHWVYAAQDTNSRFLDFAGLYPRIHFLAGSDPEEVNQAVFYGYCGSITSSPGNREILGLHKSIIEAVKKFRKTSKSDRVVLKFITASPEVAPVPALSWMFVQLCTPNRANIKIGNQSKDRTLPDVNPLWISDRRAAGFAVLYRKLQHIQQTNKGFMYNAPNNIYIYADGTCQPRFDALNKISAGISLINSCRVPGSFPTQVHLCGLLHQEKTSGCCICPTRQ